MNIPLAEKLRPQLLTEIVGQNHLTGIDGFLTKVIASHKPLSILLYGPPGCGKTSIARLYASSFEGELIQLSAVFSSISDIKKLISQKKDHPLFQKQLILFVDEIHRFNKAQQDAFLPFMEDGTIILIGATTENPSFALNNALLSRLRVLTLNPLSSEYLEKIISFYEQKFTPLKITDNAKQLLIELAQGDARHLINLIENIDPQNIQTTLDEKKLANLLQKKPPLFDKHDDNHYNLISALHKSIRGSDPDASVYWLCRMLIAGEDPFFILRRMIRMAVEDIGLADPNALLQCNAAWDSFHKIGPPEGDLIICQTVIYLALAPKSNAAYTAYSKAKQDAEKTSHLSPPSHIINAPTAWMKKEGFGKDYAYDHETKHGFSGQNYFPQNMDRACYYHPHERGFEREMKKRLDYFIKLRNTLSKQ